MKYSELANCEVINIRTCKKLGYVSDLVFECKCYKIEALIVPGPGHFCGLFPLGREYIIPVSQIRHIGTDIILVDICEEELLQEHSKTIRI